MRTLITILLAATIGCGRPATALPTVDRITIEYQDGDVGKDTEMERVVNALHFRHLSGLRVRVGICGTVNAFFSTESGVLMCSELIEYVPPGAARWILAHEMGHALIHHAGIPITGSDEDAADEFATVMMIAAGMDADVDAVWNMFLEWSEDDEGEHYRDEHSSNIRRAYDQFCLVEGSRGTMRAVLIGCESRWRKTVKRWAVLVSGLR